MSLTAKFTSLPEDQTKAVFNSDNGRLEAPFTLAAEFGGKDAKFGEYRQYIRGYFARDGKKLRFKLCDGKTLKEQDYQEDGCGPNKGCTAYGYRTCPQYEEERAIDLYQPNRKTGKLFNMLDIPGLGHPGPTKGGSISLHIEFRGVLVDVRTDKILKSEEWIVEGQHAYQLVTKQQGAPQMSSGQTVEVTLSPSGDEGWAGTLVLFGPTSENDPPQIRFGSVSANGNPIQIDAERMSDLIEMGNERHRTWQVDFFLVNEGEPPATLVGDVNGEAFQVDLVPENSE